MARKKSKLGISYVIGPNGKKVSLKTHAARRLHGHKGDKAVAAVRKDVWHNKYAIKSN